MERNDDVGLGIEQIKNEKGRAVIAKRDFSKGDPIVEYKGELLSYKEAEAKEAEYAKKGVSESFMYFFKFKDNGYCVDATKEDGRLGRLVSHSALNPNCGTKVEWFDGKPRLLLFAKKDIKESSELLFDYGERRKNVVDDLPWLVNS